MTSGPELQPGTRCGCNSQDCCARVGHGKVFGRATPNSHCKRSAVRMVTVHTTGHGSTGQGWRDTVVPMCEPCADFAERAR